MTDRIGEATRPAPGSANMTKNTYARAAERYVEQRFTEKNHMSDSQLGFFQEVNQFFQRNLLISTFWMMRLIFQETSITKLNMIHQENF
jgi:hypothetical protein